MKRLFTVALLGAALTIGTAACGSDDKPSTTTAKSETTVKGGTTETTAKGGTTSANADVAKYCDDVKTFVAAVKAAGTDTTKLAALQTQATELVTSGTKLASSGLSAADAQTLSDCTTEAGKAFTG